MLLRALDAEMKDATGAGVTLEIKKEEKPPVTENGEQMCWELGPLCAKSAKSLLFTLSLPI